jgi:alpha-N-arabinofuranosidase
MEYIPLSENDLAGIVCFQNERFHYVFGITRKDKSVYLILQRTEKGQATIVASNAVELKNPIHLRVKANGDDYQFGYSFNGSDFEYVGGTVSGDILSTNVAGGFTGALIGIYATTVNPIKP